MRLAAWRRMMFAVGALLLLAGAALMVGGGLYAGRQQYAPGGDAMTGIWVGTFGTLGVVSGVVMLKLALLGPVPKSMQGEAQTEPEVED